MTEPAKPADPAPHRHFIHDIIDADIASGKWGTPGDRTVVTTRFPPEPNGFLHVGHAKSIALNAGLAREYGGRFILRFDDTNPAKEEQAFVDSITEDIKWLVGDFDGEPRFASDYFGQMHDYAVELIDKGLAYVDEQEPEAIKAQRGVAGKPGEASPFRDRPAEESRAQFERMVRGDVPTGGMVLRARIDMASPNFNLRDPVMYRVVNTPHHRTAARWHVYPMYDWAHGIEDSIEGVTHSLCTLEFENHRPLYDWFINAINKDRPEKIHHSQQIEFSKLRPSFTVMGKRHMRKLVEDGHVEGWDDPRMPTVSGLRRRGFTSASIRAYCEAAGVTKYEGTTDPGRLDNAIREELNPTAARRMAVLRPIKVVIESWPEGEVDWLDAVNNPESEAGGTRQVPFGRELFIERDDFMEVPVKGFRRLAPGKEVRLRYGYWITCTEVIKDDAGNVVELRCTHDPETRGGDSPPPDAEGKVRKVKGTLHWVSCEHTIEREVRLYDRLFSAEKPGSETGEMIDDLNPGSIEVIADAKLEPALAEAQPGERVQFERLGYFFVDPKSGAFNRTATLKDSWKPPKA